MTDIAQLIVDFYILFHRKEFQYPLVCEENARFMSFKEKMWFGYKMLGRPMERAEKDSGIEGYFEAQNLEFSAPEGFRPQAEVCISAGGDLLASRNISRENAKQFWDQAEDFLFSADISCANLETPVVPSIPPTFVPKTILKEIALNNSPEVFDIYHRGGSGIDLFTTANNHSLDMGPEGCCETLDFLDERGCLHVGTARSVEERDQFPVIEKNRIRTAFLSYTYALNNKVLPEGREYLANYQRLNLPGADLSDLERHIRMAKTERNADLVVACLHFSTEFDSYPLQRTIDMAHRVMELGVDVIVGNHAHVVQPMERYEFTDPYSGLRKSGLISYALGDLVTPTERVGMINSRVNTLLKFSAAKGEVNGKTATFVSDVAIRPMYIFNRFEGNVCREYRLLNLAELLEDIESGNAPEGMTEDVKTEVKRLGQLTRNVLPWELIG